MTSTGRAFHSRANCRYGLSLLLLSLTVWLSGCDEPFVVMAGGKLSGDVAEPLEDWSVLNDVEIVQIETNPEKPYSVNVWMIARGPYLYIATDEGETRWTRNMDANPAVRLRVDGKIYELHATRVTDEQEKRSIGKEYVKKYGVDEDDDDNWVQNGQLFRLGPRQSY